MKFIVACLFTLLISCATIYSQTIEEKYKSKRISYKNENEPYKNYLKYIEHSINFSIAKGIGTIAISNRNKTLIYNINDKKFGVVLKSGSTAIITAHNHPSGNLIPSKQDVHIHEKIKRIAETMDISLLDNLIISKEEFYSFADK